MKVLKILGTTVCSILLFLALSVLSVAFLLNSTVLNPDFMNAQIDKLDTSEITQDLIDDQLKEQLPQGSEFLLEITYSIINDEEVLIKAQVNGAIDEAYSYILGEKDTLELSFSLAAIKQDLKNNVWDVAIAYLNHKLANMSEAEVDAYVQTIADQIPPDILPRELAALPSSLQNQVVTQYLKELGGRGIFESVDFELDFLIEDQVRSAVEQYFNDYIDQVPDTYVLDESTMSAGVMNSIRDVKTYIGYFQMAYIWLIIFVVVMMGLIFLINWSDVRASARSLGIDLLIFGVLDLAGVLVIKSTSIPGLFPGFKDIPVSMQNWVQSVITDITGKMMIFSIGVIIAGIILMVLSFIVKNRQQAVS